MQAISISTKTKNHANKKSQKQKIKQMKKEKKVIELVWNAPYVYIHICIIVLYMYIQDGGPKCNKSITLKILVESKLFFHKKKKQIMKHFFEKCVYLKL